MDGKGLFLTYPARVRVPKSQNKQDKHLRFHIQSDSTHLFNNAMLNVKAFQVGFPDPVPNNYLKRGRNDVMECELRSLPILFSAVIDRVSIECQSVTCYGQFALPVCKELNVCMQLENFVCL